MSVDLEELLLGRVVSEEVAQHVGELEHSAAVDHLMGEIMIVIMIVLIQMIVVIVQMIVIMILLA